MEDTFIASAMSPTQKSLLKQHPQKTPLFVEGGYNVWLRDKYMTYFVLRADPTPSKHIPKRDDDEGNRSEAYCLVKCVSGMKVSGIAV